MTTQADVAAHLDLTDRRIRELIDRGILPTAARGEYDLEACRIAYIRWLREVAAGRKDEDDDSSLSAERARLAAEQADNIALKNETLRRERLPASEVNAAVTAAFGRVKTRLLQLPARAAPTDRALRAHVAKLVHEALEELSATEVLAAPEDATDTQEEA